MKFELAKASKRLSALEIKLSIGNMPVDILWFRAMVVGGEWFINRHTHSTFEFHFITAGACRVILDEGDFEVKAGEFYITAPMVYHAQKNASHETTIEYCINYDIKQPESCSPEADYIFTVLRETPCRPVKDTEGAIKLFGKALSEAYHQNLGFYNNIKCLASIILSSSARMVSRSSAARYDIPLKRKKDDYRIIQIKRFIQDNISNNISTNDIGRCLYLGEKQVCRIIKDTMGISTKELIIQIKLQKAKELLRDTDLTIKQISDCLGFSSQYYFAQFFKRNEGYPPGVFRYNVRNV